ncbi:MAG: hypothetical protein M1144_01970 [Candidatus Thermoplasmatota archaeon]|nr:hypothetical protein [Candidatus Thermoplasmatota archaeon]
MADTDAEKTIRELLPKLLKEKPSFRYEVEDILSDRLVVKDEIKDLIKEMHQGFEENAREHKSFEERMEQNAREHREILQELHRDIGGIGETLGAMHEGLYVPKVIEAFEKLHGLAATSLRNVAVGEQGHTEEVDALVHDGTVWVLEVSATVRNSDVDRVEAKAQKVRALSEFQGKKVVPVVAGTRIPDSVKARAQEAGVEVFKE